MFQNAQQAQEWLKALGYPVVEPLVFSNPPLPNKGATRHIREWALLTKLDDGLPVHIYWLHAMHGSGLNDVKYAALLFGHKYPNIHSLIIARYQRREQWLCVLVCPNYEEKWGSAFHKEITPDEEIAALLRYDPAVPVEKHWQRIYATLRGKPMNERVKQVLDSCIAELENLLGEINANIKRAVDEGNYAHSQLLIQEAESVKQRIVQIAQLRG